MQHLNQQLSQLNLNGCKAALAHQNQHPEHHRELSFEERLSLLLEQELAARQQRKVERLLRQAKFRLNAELSQLDYRAERNITSAQVRSLTQGDWLNLNQSLLLTGATGCGKTYLACALGHYFCRQGHSVYYFRLKALLEKMYLAQADGSYRKFVTKLAMAKVLILDDWGLEPLTAQQRSDLLELIDARYGLTSTIIASQLPLDKWYDMIGESTHADAILDRLVHSGIRLDLKGGSMRKSGANLTDGDHSS